MIQLNFKNNKIFASLLSLIKPFLVTLKAFNLNFKIKLVNCQKQNV